MTRAFDVHERRFLEAIGNCLPVDQRRALLEDIDAALVTEDRGVLMVELPHYRRPDDPRHCPIPFEGHMAAVDGGQVLVLVFQDQDGRLLEVEFIRWESPEDTPLDWSSVRVVPEPPLGVSEWK